MRVIFFLLLMISPAMAGGITMDVNKDKIGISVGFDGDILTVFGTKRPHAGVAVVVEGPRKDTIVRRKSRVLGAWVHTDSEKFKDAPLFYDYALTDKIEDTYSYVPDEKIPDPFKKAFVRNKQNLGHFAKVPRPIQVYEDGRLFRADFRLPSSVPVGEYTIMLFESGQSNAAVTRHVMVSQSGNNARIKLTARYHAFLYGLACIGLALFAGWFSNRIRLKV